MSIKITDEAIVESFRSASEPEIVESSTGQLLGRFVPLKGKMSIPEVGLTDEELIALADDPNAKRCSGEEVMERLREIDRCTR